MRSEREAELGLGPSGKQQRQRGARRMAALAEALGRAGCELAWGGKLAAKRDKEAERDRSAIYEA